MSKLYVNGESVSSSVNYASAVNCIDKDGNKSTVQAEIDKLHMNSKDYVALSPSAITDLTIRAVGQWTIVPLKIDYQGSDEYSVTYNGGLNPTSQGMFAVSGQVWFEQCTASNMMQVSLWTWDNTNGDIQVTAPTLSVATTAGYATIVIPRVYLDFTGDKVLFLRVRNNNSATGAVPADWTTRLYVDKLYIESASTIANNASDISCTDAEGNESNVQSEIDKLQKDLSERTVAMRNVGICIDGSLLMGYMLPVNFKNVPKVTVINAAIAGITAGLTQTSVEIDTEGTNDDEIVFKLTPTNGITLTNNNCYFGMIHFSYSK